jgi:exopolyphosphatase/pppGpp-phosphohydrolase
MAALLAGLDGAELTRLGIEESRHDTIRPGAVILGALLEQLGIDVATVSQRGLREGVALRELSMAGVELDPRRRALAAPA